MALPHAGRCHVGREKILGYLLNVTHPQGWGKAQFFQSRGFTRENWTDFADALKRHAIENPVAETTRSPHGIKYLVTCHIETPDGRNPCIRSVWIDEGDQQPRLVTAHPR